jgi:multisubunit Na+/H+ antiporter MnhF subunit
VKRVHLEAIRRINMLVLTVIGTNFGNFIQGILNGPAGSVIRVFLYIGAALMLIPLFRTIKRERRQLRIGGIIEITFIIVGILILLDPVQGIEIAINSAVSFGSWIISLFQSQVRSQGQAG